LGGHSARGEKKGDNMNLRQQIVQNHIETTAKILSKKEDDAFMYFAHSLFTDISVHSIPNNDIVDGGQDKQIDAITIEETGDEADIYITQSKNEDSFSSNRIIHIRNGLSWLFEKKNSDIETLTNLKFKDKIKEYRQIQSNIGPSNIRVYVAYITNGIEDEISDECKQEIKTILDKYDNETFATFKFEMIGANTIVEQLSKQDKKNKKVNTEIKIVYDANNPSLIKYHSKELKGIVCSTSALEIARIVNDDKNGYVFDLNIRKYLGNLGGVNKDIISTCISANTSHLFWFLNNGITIVCEKFDPITDPDSPKVKIENMQIVNGCQTATSLANAFKDGQLQSDTRVLLRIYESADLSIVDRIVLTTNNQNKISGRNLKANEKTQIDVETGFKGYNYFLERKNRQYETTQIDVSRIIPNEIVATSYLAIIMKKPSDARARKYKVWEELYQKVFSGKEIVELYLLSTLIMKGVQDAISAIDMTSIDEKTRFLYNNASFHLARICFCSIMGTDKKPSVRESKEKIKEIESGQIDFREHVVNAIDSLNTCISNMLNSNQDLSALLKTNDLDIEITKKVNSKI
jgi:hypothetical protein